MKTNGEPLIQTRNAPAGVALDEPPPSGHSTFGGQGGGPSPPGRCGSPAVTGTASRDTKTSGARNLFTVDTPLVTVVERGGIASAKTSHGNTNYDADLVLFRTLSDRKDFDALTRLCRERLLTARDPESSLRWVKDRAIVEALRENYAGSYDLLAGAHYLAQGSEGRLRGKYEHEFGITLARLGRSSLALERFGVAYQNLRSAAEPGMCASVDTARARALHTRGEYAKAMRYLKRALDYARATDDLRLELEALESIREFGGMS